MPLVQTPMSPTRSTVQATPPLPRWMRLRQLVFQPLPAGADEPPERESARLRLERELGEELTALLIKVCSKGQGRPGSSSP